ncbi:hypothetical protein CRE_11336 [Caenorhabditis remanei]|uniref:Uncharacterized protein n=1 Tax=Caenorhabditis remanei TaxID=31234 RepID=E3N0E5_CAERE|nr:hypothetical protein CRE_11336 [Caenorhabditis remanei]
MNQHTFHVDSQGGTVNFTINNVCNIIVAPNTFVPPPFHPPQEDPPTYNNHQNEGATRSREHEQNDNGDAPNRTTNATTLPEGHSDELPPPRENRSPPNVIILPYLVDNEQQAVIPVEHRLLPSNNPLSVATQGEITDTERKDSEQARGYDESAQTGQTLEADARIAEMSMNDAFLTDVEMDVTPLAETLITDDETAAAQTEEVQTADGETAHAPIIDGQFIDVQMDTTPITDGPPVNEQLADTPMGDTSSTNVHLAQNLDTMAPTFEIKDTATPFFVRNISLEVPLRFIMYTTKYPTNESYNRVLGNSQCKTRAKSYLADESFINEIEMNLYGKGKKDFHDIIRTTIDHFARDAATAVRLANRFLQSTR